MSLKHRGGSKYARKQMIYAKYDVKVRKRKNMYTLGNIKKVLITSLLHDRICD